MNETRGPMEKRLRIAGFLIILGLLVEAFSLIWTHPVAFIVFIVVGGLAMGIGMIMYLYSLVTVAQVPGKQ